MDFQEYSHIKAETKGCMAPGKLRLTNEHVIFQNKKTGKAEQIQASLMDAVSFQNFSGSWGIRMFLKDGSLRRFVGFKDSDKEKIRAFFKATYRTDILDEELSVKGWNWGTAKFQGSALSFDVDGRTAFEIPLDNVSKCSSGKNEVAMEFHHSDSAPVSLMEMRFFVSPTDTESTIEAFQRRVTDKANAMGVPTDAIATLEEIQSVTPRGRYDIKIFPTFFQLHGKTFDYKIPISSVIGLFNLPHKDGRQTFFVVSLNPPIKQGQTRYHFLVLLFGTEDASSIELSSMPKELSAKLQDEFEDEISGPTYEILGKILKTIAGKKIVMDPGDFVGHSGTPAIGCSYKAAAGYLYPLEKGFIYVHKPPVHISLEEVSTVNFARSGGSTRSFDFEVELTSGIVYTFSSIEKEEYAELFDFVVSKKLIVKDKGLCNDTVKNEDFGKTGIDAYLERIKAETDSIDGEDATSSTADGSSVDDDFKPDKSESDISDEIHTSSGSEDTLSSSEENEAITKSQNKKSEVKKKPKTMKKGVGTRVSAKDKGKKDSSKPKRASSAYMIWLNATRSEIKANNPGLKMTEIAKKAGELWRQLEDKSEWEKKAAEAKKEYAEAIRRYKATKENSKDKKGKNGPEQLKKSKKKSPNRNSPVKGKAQATKRVDLETSSEVDVVKLEKKVGKNATDTWKSGPYTSKEFISDTDSTTSNEDEKKQAPKKGDEVNTSGSKDESDSINDKDKENDDTKSISSSSSNIVTDSDN